jgi:transposase
MRRDLQPLRPGDEIAIDLRILTARRTDLVADRTRAINRLRAQLLEYFPALERAFDYSNSKAALILLSGYQTPDGLRRIGAVNRPDSDGGSGYWISTRGWSVRSVA